VFWCTYYHTAGPVPTLAHLWPDYPTRRIINLVRRAGCLYFVGLCVGLGYFVAHVVAHRVKWECATMGRHGGELGAHHRYLPT